MISDSDFQEIRGASSPAYCRFEGKKSVTIVNEQTGMGLRLCTKCEDFRPFPQKFRLRKKRGGIKYESWCEDCVRAGRRTAYAANSHRPEVKARRRREYKAAQYKRLYGITIADYNQMLTEQKGLCAVCRRPPADGGREKLCVDHCHDTGKVRGLLCNRCNTGLGMFRDDTVLMQKAIDYVA